MITTLDQWIQQIKDLFRSMWIVYASVVSLLGFIIILRVFYHIPIGYLTRDPGDIIRHNPISNFPFYQDGIVNLPFYLGALSYIGILFWCATIAICFFSFVILRKADQKGPALSFYFLAGVISTLLLIDDLFRFHEIVFPVYLHLHEYVLYASYAVLILFLLVRFRVFILNTDYLLLLFALGCLGLSLFADMITDVLFSKISGATMIEDGAKFIGIVSWFMYFFRICHQHIMQLINQKV